MVHTYTPPHAQYPNLHMYTHTHNTHTFFYSLTGFVLEGFDLEHSCDLLGTVIRATTELLPVDKPRFIHGIGTPGGAPVSSPRTCIHQWLSSRITQLNL